MDSLFRSLCRGLIGVLVGGLAATGTSAGVLDPVPLINGTEKAKALFLVPGVSTSVNRFGTIITCTSLEKSKEQTVAVEVFGEETGSVINDITAGEGVVTGVVPGETIMFEVAVDGLIAATGSDENISTSISLLHGSARVVSTGRKLMCTAGVIDSENNPPLFAMDLSVVSKKQKGD